MRRGGIRRVDSYLRGAFRGQENAAGHRAAMRAQRRLIHFILLPPLITTWRARPSSALREGNPSHSDTLGNLYVDDHSDCNVDTGPKF